MNIRTIFKQAGSTFSKYVQLTDKGYKSTLDAVDSDIAREYFDSVQDYKIALQNIDFADKDFEECAMLDLAAKKSKMNTLYNRLKEAFPDTKVSIFQ